MKFIPIFTVRARTAIGIGVSLLIHALILFFILFHPSTRKEQEQAGPAVSTPMTVNLIPLAPETKVTASSPITLPPQPQKAPRPKASPRPQKAVARKRTESVKPDNVARSQPSLPTSKSSNTQAAQDAPTDMMGMINAARERRRAAGMPTEPEDSSSESQKPSDNDIARANIAHSMRMASGNDGLGGVFQITRKGVRTAEFIFRGWDVAKGTDLHQMVEVDAGLNGDIELAIVQKMIELIRKHQPGDINWDSHRLGRVVVLSARVEDNDILVEFLKHEFFDDAR